jgi:CubicO group peptidase (beta-lactamase class C family)
MANGHEVIRWISAAILLGIGIGTSGCRTGTDETAPQIIGKMEPHAIGEVKESMDWTKLDAIIGEELASGKVPGAVVCAGKGSEILYLKAFGSRTIVPDVQPMMADTIFDLASLTKPLATAGCILILMDHGKLSPDDPACRWLANFDTDEKRGILIRHLLTHTSGLPPYMDAEKLKSEFGEKCPDRVIEAIGKASLLSRPGEAFRYSCLGYITLGRIVEIVSGKTLDQFAAENIYRPMGMNDTRYCPPDGWRDRIAGTEGGPDAAVNRVHDPLARLMGGVSGNAGLYSTASDLARYCAMVLHGGTYDGRRIFSDTAVQRLTQTQDANTGRAFGFDVSSDYAWLKGKSASKGAFCHSGYTGTSIVCDPESGVFVIILTNRVHPEDRGQVRGLRNRVADEVFGRFVALSK